jgi:hypothetical protein
MLNSRASVAEYASSVSAHGRIAVPTNILEACAASRIDISGAATLSTRKDPNVATARETRHFIFVAVSSSIE